MICKKLLKNDSYNRLKNDRQLVPLNRASHNKPSFVPKINKK